jgi:hypothetical protein
MSSEEFAQSPPYAGEGGASKNPDQLEVAPGQRHEHLEGWIPELASEEEVRSALEKAFDYRGDVTITSQDGSKITGYIFDRRSGDSLGTSFVRVMVGTGEKVVVCYGDIAGLAFSGRDTAAGRSWEAWLRKYWEKRAVGEKISLAPESLE